MGNHFVLTFNDKEKYCPMCKKWLEIDSFYTSKYSKSGRRAYCKQCHMLLQRHSLKKWKYGLSKDDLEKMMTSQNGGCDICKVKFSYSRKFLSPAVDHKHDETKKIRGLLCGYCNFLIGNSREDITILKSAIKYLKKHE